MLLRVEVILGVFCCLSIHSAISFRMVPKDTEQGMRQMEHLPGDGYNFQYPHRPKRNKFNYRITPNSKRMLVHHQPGSTEVRYPFSESSETQPNYNHPKTSNTPVIKNHQDTEIFLDGDNTPPDISQNSMRDNQILDSVENNNQVSFENSAADSEYSNLHSSDSIESPELPESLDISRDPQDVSQRFMDNSRTSDVDEDYVRVNSEILDEDSKFSDSQSPDPPESQELSKSLDSSDNFMEDDENSNSDESYSQVSLENSAEDSEYFDSDSPDSSGSLLNTRRDILGDRMTVHSDGNYSRIGSGSSVEDPKYSDLDSLESQESTGSPDSRNVSNLSERNVFEKWIPTNCSQNTRKSSDRYSSSFAFNNTKQGLSGDTFPNPGEREAVKSSSVFVGEDVTLCWIETITITEDKSIQPPKKVVFREFTISVENSATIPEKYLECGKLEGELEPGCQKHQGKTGLFDVVDEDSKVSKLVNFTTISNKGNIEVRKHKNVRCAVGPVVTKNIIEFEDESKNPKKRVEVKVSPRMRKINEDGEGCLADEDDSMVKKPEMGLEKKFGEVTMKPDGEPSGKLPVWGRPSVTENPIYDGYKDGKSKNNVSKGNEPTNITPSLNEKASPSDGNASRKTLPPDGNEKISEDFISPNDHFGLITDSTTKKISTDEKVPDDEILQGITTTKNIISSNTEKNGSCYGEDCPGTSGSETELFNKEITSGDDNKMKQETTTNLAGEIGSTTIKSEMNQESEKEGVSCEENNCSSCSDGGCSSEPDESRVGDHSTISPKYEGNSTSSKSNGDDNEPPGRGSRNSPNGKSPSTDIGKDMAASGVQPNSTQTSEPESTLLIPLNHGTYVTDVLLGRNPEGSRKIPFNNSVLHEEHKKDSKCGSVDCATTSQDLIESSGGSTELNEVELEFPEVSTRSDDDGPRSPVIRSDSSEEIMQFLDEVPSTPPEYMSTSAETPTESPNSLESNKNLSKNLEGRKKYPKSRSESESSTPGVETESPDSEKTTLSSTDSRPKMTDLGKEEKGIHESEDIEDIPVYSDEEEPITLSASHVETTVPSPRKQSKSFTDSLIDKPGVQIPDQLPKTTGVSKIETTHSPCPVDDEECISQSDSGEIEEHSKIGKEMLTTTTNPGGELVVVDGNTTTTTENESALESNPTSKHRLGLRIKILLEHINEDEERKNLIEVDKHLMLNEDSKEHENNTILNQIKALNDSVTAQTIRALLNCTTLQKLSNEGFDIEVDESTLVPEGRVDSKKLTSNQPILSVEDESDDGKLSLVRRKRDLADDSTTDGSFTEGSFTNDDVKDDRSTDGSYISGTSTEGSSADWSLRDVIPTGDIFTHGTSTETNFAVTDTFDLIVVNATKSEVYTTDATHEEQLSDEDTLTGTNYTRSSNDRPKDTNMRVNQSRIIEDYLPDIQKDINTGINHAVAKLENCMKLNCFPEVRNLNLLPISSILGIISNPKDSRIHARTKRDDEDVREGENAPVKLDTWSNERIRRNADGHHIRSLTEITIFGES